MAVFEGGSMGQKKIRRITNILLLVCLMSASTFVQPACAETQYVTDMLILTLREGPGNEFNVIQILRTGMALDVLEEQEKYTKVRTQNGKEGWVSKQYLTSEAPKTILIEKLSGEVNTLKEKIERLEQRRISLTDRMDSSNKDYVLKIQKLENEVETYKNEAVATAKKLHEAKNQYDTLASQSKNVVALAAERDSVRKENEILKDAKQDMEKAAEAVEAENQQLVRNEILHWFLAGGGVFFIGLIIGKVSRKKKRY